MASLSARVGSSLLGTFADRMQHMSHRFTLTARRSALLNGEPCEKSSLHSHLQFSRKGDKRVPGDNEFLSLFPLCAHVIFPPVCFR